MRKLCSGEFFGVTDLKLELDGLILTNTGYTHDYVDWHHHQNAYFTFILNGKLIEGNHKGKHYLSAGSLMFHHAQEAHYNVKPKGDTRGMHIELNGDWVRDFNDKDLPHGSFEVKNASLKLMFYNILKESRIADDVTALGIHCLMSSVIAGLSTCLPQKAKVPAWVFQAEVFLQDHYRQPLALTEMAGALGVHPVHLSRAFARYFGCSMASYVRKVRTERAFARLAVKGQSLSEIAHACGFADQSHMVRSFREFNGMTPGFFRKLIHS